MRLATVVGFRMAPDDRNCGHPLARLIVDTDDGYFCVSHGVTFDGKLQAYAFRCDKDGEVTDWGEIRPGSLDHTTDPYRVLARMGFTHVKVPTCIAYPPYTNVIDISYLDDTK